MIYGPGGYRFSDYLRFGGPLNLLVMALTVTLAPLLWPFSDTTAPAAATGVALRSAPLQPGLEPTLPSPAR
jgi:hypothetical protein